MGVNVELFIWMRVGLIPALSIARAGSVSRVCAKNCVVWSSWIMGNVISSTVSHLEDGICCHWTCDGAAGGR